MARKNYEAPEAELLVVRFEKSILSDRYNTDSNEMFNRDSDEEDF